MTLLVDFSIYFNGYPPTTRTRTAIVVLHVHAESITEADRHVAIKL